MAGIDSPGRLRALLVAAVRAGLIAIVGGGLGLAHNAMSAQGIPLSTPQSMTVSDHVTWNLHLMGMRVRSEDAKQAFDDRTAVFMDARSRRAYEAGHIPGAIHLMGSEVMTRGKALLKDHLRDIRIITYCSGGRCQSSMRLASKLMEDLGFTNVGAYYEGWAVWMKSGYPVAKGVDP
jgi:rhodanese-related sulfurtransferase